MGSSKLGYGNLRKQFLMTRLEHPTFSGIRPQGFTLVELMVVVALLGILASIAVSNYLKFAANARKAEAKIALGAIYTAEVAFFVEQSSFTTCLSQAGYAPTGSSKYYVEGFDHVAMFFCGSSGKLDCETYDYTSGKGCGVASQYYPANANVGKGGPTGVMALVDALPAAMVSTNGFIAAAVGNISSSENTNVYSTLDAWEIDQMRLSY